MSDEAPKVGVFSIEPRDWRQERLAVSKEIHLNTELGLRVYLIYVGFAPRADGELRPMLMLRFNFSWGVSGDGGFFGFTLKRRDEVLAFTVVERKTAGATTDMVSFDDAGVIAMMMALATQDDLLAELHGPDGVNIDFPVPFDPKFYPMLRTVLNQVTANNHAQNR